MKKKTTWLGLLFLMHTFMGCVEEFDAQIENLETVLVIDARLTDEAKPQTIHLTNTFGFDSDEPKPELGAQVALLDDLNNMIVFTENTPGIYSTASALQLNEDRTYRLEVIRTDGSRYISSEEKLPSNTPIERVEAQRKINNSGLDGVAITLNVQGQTDNNDYYRYEYVETTQIIAPDYNPFEWDEVDYDHFCEDDDGWQVTIKPRQEQARVCYASAISRDLILASTEELNSSSLERFEVRFLSKENYFISHRYSILVKQYHLSPNTASFYRTLQDFSNSESVFSNVQTGLIEGNITAENNQELVLGYFELSSFSEMRMFFNYEDLFPNEPLPPYIINCEPIGAPSLYPPGFHTIVVDGKIVIDGTSNSPLIDAIQADLIGYLADNQNYFGPDLEGPNRRAPFLVKSLGCLDCRQFGSNVAPEFWTEE